MSSQTSNSNFKKSLRDSLEIEEIIISDDDDDIADANTFSNESNRNMNNHDKNKGTDNQPKLKCSFCDFKTLLKETLISHNETHNLNRLLVKDVILSVQERIP